MFQLSEFYYTLRRHVSGPSSVAEGLVKPACPLGFTVLGVACSGC